VSALIFYYMSAQHVAVVDSDNKSRSSQIITVAECKPTEINDGASNLSSNTNVSLPFQNQCRAKRFEVLAPTLPYYNLPVKPQTQSKIRSNRRKESSSDPPPPSTPPMLSDSVSGQLNNLDLVPMFRSRYDRQRSSPLIAQKSTCSRRKQIEPPIRSSKARIRTSTSPKQDTCQQRGSQVESWPQNKSPLDQTILLVQCPSVKMKETHSLDANRSQNKSHMRALRSPSHLVSWRAGSREDIKMSWEVTQIMQNSNHNRRILTIIAPLCEDANENTRRTPRIKIKKLDTKFPLVTKNLEISKISKVNKSPVGCRLVIFFPSSTGRDRKVLDVEFLSVLQQEECLKYLRNLNSYFLIQEKALRLPPRWDPDDKATQCAICGNKFNLINRKHHCRMCGKCVCSNCSRTEAVLPEYGFDAPVRVDVRCYETILREKLGCSIGGLGMKRRTSGSHNKWTDWCPLPKNDLDFDIVNTSKVQKQVNVLRNHKQSVNFSAWQKYLAQNQTLNKKSKQIWKMISKGIPPEYRGHVWTKVSGCLKKRNEKPEGYYAQLLDYAKRHQNDLPFLSELEKDLHRPMKGDLNIIYDSEEAIEMLRRVLIAYAIRNRKVEYCQSMNYICALLLLFTKEEDAFWLFCYIIEDICCVDKQFYHSKALEGWIIDQCVFTVMVEKMLPGLSRHLADLQIPISVISDNWFLCLFVNSLPLRKTLRVWDLMFLEGIDPIFRGALAILTINQEKALKSHDLESLLRIFDTGWSSLNAPSSDADSDNTESDAFIKECYTKKISLIIDQLHSLRVFHRAHIEQFARKKHVEKSNFVMSLDSNQSMSRISSHGLAYGSKCGSLDKLFIPSECTALHEVSSLQDLPETNDKLNEKEKDKLARMDGRMIYMDPAYRSRFQEYSQYFGRIERNANRVEEYFGTGTPSNVQCQESPSLHHEPEASFFKEGLNSSPLPRSSSFSSHGSSSKDSPFSLIEFKGCLPANLVL